MMIGSEGTINKQISNQVDPPQSTCFILACMELNINVSFSPCKYLHF